MQTDMFAAAEAARALKMTIQSELLGVNGKGGVIANYADIVKQANETMLSAIQKLKSEIGGSGPDSKGIVGGVLDTIKNSEIYKSLHESKVVSGVLNKTSDYSQTGAYAAGAGALLTSETVIGGLTLGAIATILEGVSAVSGGFGMIADWAGLAEGGISSGPSSGYLAKLHGTEAVLPPDLTDMLMSSATVSSPSQIVEAYNNLRSTTNDHLNATQDTNDLMSSLIVKMDQLIDATKDVVGNTQRTAARVA